MGSVTLAFPLNHMDADDDDQAVPRESRLGTSCTSRVVID